MSDSGSPWEGSVVVYVDIVKVCINNDVSDIERRGWRVQTDKSTEKKIGKRRCSR